MGKHPLNYRLFWCILVIVGMSLMPAGFAAGADESFAFDEFDEFDDTVNGESAEVFDPLSGYNRFMTQVNDRLYFWFFKPVAEGYRFVVIEPVRVCIGNFFDNLGFPIRFVNNLLQMKAQPAGIEAARFGMNTTVGVLGFFDPAASWLELYPRREDFGQTLGHYGADGGFHIVLPFLGPSNLRDVMGRIPDYFLDPLNYIDHWETRLALDSLYIINETSLRIGQYEAMKKDAIDMYIFLRNAYEMKRTREIEE
jgi:phospholipid-binding lipoprotein MlaA